MEGGVRERERDFPDWTKKYVRRCLFYNEYGDKNFVQNIYLKILWTAESHLFSLLAFIFCLCLKKYDDDCQRFKVEIVLGHRYPHHASTVSSIHRYCI